ncbi:MAG: metalloregulator ArsR/SmtB family transcription factor [Proteobacteria bacterium]|nr:metalloregulator ArsR/SmtB family transcription factor [Pseudomonadota bacterium]
MSNSNFKHQLFEQFARIGKSLGSGSRLELLEYLAQGERNVESLAKASGFTVANTSQHLRQLHQAGLVTSRKSAQQVFYRLADEMVVDLLDILRKVAERNLAEIERLIKTYLTAKDELEPISGSELLNRFKRKDITILDVRPSEEFKEGHLPKAINIPLNELEKRLDRIPNDMDVVAYCRGPHCVLAFEAVAKLREAGFRAIRLEKGFPEWKRSGLPVEVAVPTSGS